VVTGLTIIVIIILTVLGASLGSFFNVLIDRIPRKESIVSPGSHCTGCGKKIKPLQNIPILSYILLKGKCDTCGSKIHWYHLVVEIMTPLLFVALFLVYGLENLFFYKFLVMCGFLIPIFFIDAFHKIIPLVLSVPMALIGLIFSFIQCELDFMGFFWQFLLPVVILFGFLYLLAWLWITVFHKEGLGGGDIILMPAVAAYFGAIHTPFVIILSCLLGIAYFVIFIRKPNQVFAFGNLIAIAAILWAMCGEPLLRMVTFLKI
jgi:leader peptidase (prepilin peptidase) / N-methyltransferase